MYSTQILTGIINDTNQVRTNEGFSGWILETG